MDDVLHRAQVKVALENTICHKNWGGRMIATCSVTAPSSIICDALVSVKAPGKKVEPTGKVDRAAIVFGESPVKLCRHPYTCFVVRSSLSELKEFYTNAFDGGKDAIYFRSAYRAKNPVGDFFTVANHTIRDGKRHKTEKNLREDVDALFASIDLDGSGSIEEMVILTAERWSRRRIRRHQTRCTRRPARRQSARGSQTRRPCAARPLRYVHPSSSLGQTRAQRVGPAHCGRRPV